MKKILSILAVFLLILMPFSTAFAADIPDITNEDFCIVDEADVISQDTENYLSALNYDLQKQTGASIVIATVDFTGRTSIDEYAYQAFNEWGVGDRNKDNGLLVVMSIGDEDYFAVQGSGIEKDLTSAEISDMLYEYMEEDFARRDYDAAAESFYMAAYEWFGDFYNVELLGLPSGVIADSEYGENINEGSGFSVMKLMMWVLVIAIIVIIISAVVGSNQPKSRKAAPKKVYRKGPHTSSYRRAVRTPSSTTRTQPKVFSVGSSKPKSSSSAKSTRTSKSSVPARKSTSSSTRSASKPMSSSSRSSISSGRKSGGFGGGSTRGGGAGRRK